MVAWEGKLVLAGGHLMPVIRGCVRLLRRREDRYNDLLILHIAALAGGWQCFGPMSFHLHTPVRHRMQYHVQWW